MKRCTAHLNHRSPSTRAPPQSHDSGSWARVLSTTASTCSGASARWPTDTYLRRKRTRANKGGIINFIIVTKIVSPWSLASHRISLRRWRKEKRITVCRRVIRPSRLTTTWTRSNNTSTSAIARLQSSKVNLIIWPNQSYFRAYRVWTWSRRWLHRWSAAQRKWFKRLARSIKSSTSLMSMTPKCISHLPNSIFLRWSTRVRQVTIDWRGRHLIYKCVNSLCNARQAYFLAGCQARQSKLV